MRTCTECGQPRPNSKFNPESFSPTVCFRCRVSGVSVGFGGYRDQFHGNEMGGTIAESNRRTIAEARSQGHDPVPVSRGVSHGLTAGQMSRLKTAIGG